jgi:phosphoribosylaminoimidazole carboxylase (NCAIR synthetase)
VVGGGQLGGMLIEAADRLAWGTDHEGTTEFAAGALITISASEFIEWRRMS